MDTKALERFCPWARTELIEAVKTRCLRYGLDDAGRAAAPADSDIAAEQVLSSEEKNQRRALYPVIEEMGYKAFCEREAYSWFNRFVAIRFMELNGYLSNHVRMLSASDGSFDPECLRAVGEIGLPGLERDTVLDLAAEGNDEELFRLILVAQCNELAQALPNIFGKVKEADALTLPDTLTTPGEHNVLQHLVTDIPEVDENGERPWEHIEILGWMYQFYNAEAKAEFFKSKRKAEAKDIAPATQLFTPEWIVRYMVDNSLGRLWMLNFPDSRLRERAKEPNPDERLMEYYIEPDEEHEDFIRIAGPEEITFCDPACGSGHILVYAFKMLFAMYEERGYRSREIPELILTKNLSGMEIDERAAQIAELCLALCARKHDRRFFTRGVTADITVLKSIVFDEEELPETSALVTHRKQDLLDGLAHLSEIGSLLTVDEGELGCIRDDAVTISHVAASSANAFLGATAQKLEKARSACEALARQFNVVVANPPYMGSSSFNPFVAKWMKKHYPDSCKDLCTAFIERGYALTHGNGYNTMVTMASWMFLNSFEKLRNKVLEQKGIVALLYMGHMVMRIAFNTCATIFFNGKNSNKGAYSKIESKHLGLDGFPANFPPSDEPLYRADATIFHNIPGSPIAYWASPSLGNSYLNGTLSNRLRSAGRLKTHDNARYLRNWWEPSNEPLFIKWRPLANGGGFSRWSGMRYDVVDYSASATANYLKHGGLPNPDCLSIEGICWGIITSGLVSFRIKKPEELFSSGSPTIIPKRKGSADLLFHLAFLNSSVTSYILDITNPTVNTPVGNILLLPECSLDVQKKAKVDSLASECIRLSEENWNSQETSWEFKRNALV